MLAGYFGDTYAYTLGTSPGGQQILTPQSVGPALKAVVPGPADRLGLQPGAPIYATVIATDAVGNPTVWADQNPVVWEPFGPIGGAAKDATLDDYAPPLPAEIVAALAALRCPRLLPPDAAAGPALPPFDAATGAYVRAALAREETAGRAKVIEFNAARQRFAQ